MKYRDIFGNLAIIDEVFTFPYKGANKKNLSYRLRLFAEYDNDFCYFLSVYESEEAAIAKLKECSCNTWEKIEEGTK